MLSKGKCGGGGEGAGPECSDLSVPPFVARYKGGKKKKFFFPPYLGGGRPPPGKVVGRGGWGGGGERAGSECCDLSVSPVDAEYQAG